MWRAEEVIGKMKDQDCQSIEDRHEDDEEDEDGDGPGE